jgi:outer membrane protein OmpA-like peptidoglycan-associated protein
MARRNLKSPSHPDFTAASSRPAPVEASGDPDSIDDAQPVTLAEAPSTGRPGVAAFPPARLDVARSMMTASAGIASPQSFAAQAQQARTSAAKTAGPVPVAPSGPPVISTIAAPVTDGVGLSPRIEMAQRPTRPDEAPPSAPPPPAGQPKGGIVEPPRATAPDQPAAPPAAPPAAAPPEQQAPLRVVFEANSASLTNEARAGLDRFIATLKADAARRTLLKAYTSTGSSVSETRRLSLKRGMTVRLYLIDKGIKSTRIDLQALGKSPDNGPADRVDVLPGKS